jgi:hypothetical protein
MSAAAQLGQPLFCDACADPNTPCKPCCSLLGLCALFYLSHCLGTGLLTAVRHTHRGSGHVGRVVVVLRRLPRSLSCSPVTWWVVVGRERGVCGGGGGMGAESCISMLRLVLFLQLAAPRIIPNPGR